MTPGGEQSRRSSDHVARTERLGLRDSICFVLSADQRAVFVEDSDTELLIDMEPGRSLLDQVRLRRESRARTLAGTTRGAGGGSQATRARGTIVHPDVG